MIDRWPTEVAARQLAATWQDRELGRCPPSRTATIDLAVGEDRHVALDEVAARLAGLEHDAVDARQVRLVRMVDVERARAPAAARAAGR